MNDMIAIYALVALLSVPLGIYIAFALSTQTKPARYAVWRD